MRTTKRNSEITEGKDKEERNNENLWELRRACMKNAAGLWRESNLLFENKFYSRSFMLAFTALEELGKFLIVSDFITGVASKVELEEAFRNHNIKTAYLHGNVKIDLKEDLLDSNISTLIYDKNKFKQLFKIRQSATYVNMKEGFKPEEPKKEISKELAKKIIDKVQKEIEFIHFAEDLNGRIGSKALFK